MNYLENVPSSSKKDGKKQLLSWVTQAIPSDLGIEVKDFGPSWRDGYAFMGLINAIDENLIDINQYRDSSNKHRLNTSFMLAENELGIPKLLDPDDVDIAKPDEKSVMTYVAQFLHKYPEPKVINFIIIFIHNFYLTKKFMSRHSSPLHLKTTSNNFKPYFSGCVNK